MESRGEQLSPGGELLASVRWQWPPQRVQRVWRGPRTTHSGAEPRRLADPYLAADVMGLEGAVRA